MRGLYAIADVGLLRARGIDPLRHAHALLECRPAALQIRDKRRDSAGMLALLRALGPAARALGVPLFANDRADLAALSGCDGVHVGQRDLAPAAARQVAARIDGVPRRIGMSAHNLAELELAVAALANGVPGDYVALGPVFATSSKDNPDPLIGLDGLAALCAAARPSGYPCVAIGGITLERAAAVAQICPCAAVIGALVSHDSDDAARRARAFHAALGGES